MIVNLSGGAGMSAETEEKIDAIYDKVVKNNDNIVNLFDNGVISEVAGGFTGYNTNATRCETNIGDVLYAKCGMSSGVAIDANNLIDVTDYDALVVEIVGYSEDAEGSGYNALFGLINSHKTPTAPAGGSSADNSHITDYAHKSSFGVGTKSAILNLINVTGSYYIRFSAHQSNAGGNQYLTINKMYLVKFNNL